ncbi:YqaA family protein [Aliidiomarina soli]|nr:VTT domain-containing protein [Aliidiomarina soli]
MIHSKNMLTGITVASFLESTIVPVPLEAMLIPLMQARRERLWLIALMATLGCIVGAVFGYAMGYFLFDLVGDWFIQTFSNPEQFDRVKQQMQSQGFWFVMTVGISPVPFQIAMLAAGATQFSLLYFLLATAVARSVRYFGLAAVVYIAGNKAEALIKRYKILAVIGLTAVVVLLWWLFNTFA